MSCSKRTNQTEPGQKAKELITRLSKEGFETVLLVGGGEINRAFLEENLVDELYLTLEPRIFGRGNSVFVEGDFEHVLQLLASTKLNDKGTLLLHYLVMKNGK
ncbi:MAG: dihydrofolate reductase family protein [Candidatus Levybacteria bacterium]|nr:dihydrofolate reductase family protein [Candidatus Levybacteria bacterium]